MENITEANKIAIVLASVGVHKGCTWGLLKEGIKGYKIMDNQIETREESKSLKVIKVSNGSILDVEAGYLMDQIRKKESKAITKEVEVEVSTRKKKEEQKFMAYLTGVLTGDETGTDFEEYHISVYSIKDQMRLNGIDYPTFKLKHTEILEVLKKLKIELQERIFIKLTDEEFAPIPEIDIESGEADKGLSIASTGTGVFMTFRVMGV